MIISIYPPLKMEDPTSTSPRTNVLKVKREVRTPPGTHLFSPPKASHKFTPCPTTLCLFLWIPFSSSFSSFYFLSLAVPLHLLLCLFLSLFFYVLSSYMLFCSSCTIFFCLFSFIFPMFSIDISCSVFPSTFFFFFFLFLLIYSLFFLLILKI